MFKILFFYEITQLALRSVAPHLVYIACTSVTKLTAGLEVIKLFYAQLS